jgi:hypothetical protein
MVKRILGLIVAVGAAYLLYLGYAHYRDAHSDSGEIKGDLSDGNTSEPASPVVPQPHPAEAQTGPAQTAQAQTSPVQTAVSAPAADSISPNPTNGTTFAGTGKFQVYRQGNLTWRLDTETGHSCILFATMEEWKKPIVNSHGCNNR